MNASDIKDDKIFGTSERTRTRPSRVADLIGKAKVLESFLIEKFTVPSLSTRSGESSCDSTSRLDSPQHDARETFHGKPQHILDSSASSHLDNPYT